MKTILKISVTMIAILIAFSGCNNDSNSKEDAREKLCCDIVYTSVNLSYTYWGDYSKLPYEYREYINKEQFEYMNYRAITDKLDLEYDKKDIGNKIYEINSLSYPEVYKTKEDKLYIKYNVKYECRQYDNNKKCDDIDKCDSEYHVIFKKIKDKYIIDDVYEADTGTDVLDE